MQVPQARFKAEIYRDARQEFRWRVRAPNGRIVADGAEGYRSRSDCVRMLTMLCRVAEVEHLVEPPADKT
jgi:uncharacterized protein YegP (UPF0339 family)